MAHDLIFHTIDLMGPIVDGPCQQTCNIQNSNDKNLFHQIFTSDGLRRGKQYYPGFMQNRPKISNGSCDIGGEKKKKKTHKTKCNFEMGFHKKKKKKLEPLIEFGFR